MMRREMAIFLIVGSLTVIFDFLIYRSLVWLGIFDVDFAKAVSFLAGTAFAYFANRAWTFGQTVKASGSAWRFIFLYSLTLAANVGVNTMALKMMTEVFMAMQWAFLLATGVSACLNFFGMKLFVFKAKDNANYP